MSNMLLTPEICKSSGYYLHNLVTKNPCTHDLAKGRGRQVTTRGRNNSRFCAKPPEYKSCRFMSIATPFPQNNGNIVQIPYVNNIPTMQFFNEISRYSQSKSYTLSLIEYVWDFQNNALWVIGNGLAMAYILVWVSKAIDLSLYYSYKFLCYPNETDFFHT